MLFKNNKYLNKTFKNKLIESLIKHIDINAK